MWGRPEISMASFIVNNNRSLTRREVNSIRFTREDEVGLHYPHCGALVVRAVVAWNGLKRILVDNESSVNIIFGATLIEMEVDHELSPHELSFAQIHWLQNHPKEQITLAVEVRMALLNAHHFMKFLVVDNRSTYRGVLGRLTFKGDVSYYIYPSPRNEIPYGKWHRQCQR